MAEFISTFATGFHSLVKENLTKILPGVKVLNLYDGLIHYKFDGDSRKLQNIIYFNNTFFVLKTQKSKNLNFPQLVNGLVSSRNYFLVNKGTFRVRFVQENQFAKVDKNLARRTENYVISNSKLTIDRLSPSTEIWFSIRREGFAFCGQLIFKRDFTEKNLNKGELRPELAYLLCEFAQVPEKSVIVEPFCGYGAIPVQLIKNYELSKLYVSDIDSEKIENLKNRKIFQNPAVELRCENAFELKHISDKSADLVITDPPWGYYEDIGDIKVFYEKMFDSFRRILKDEGNMLILTARKEEFEQVCRKLNLTIKKDLHTLVNGKKAGLYYLSF